MSENIMGSPKLDGLRCIIAKDDAFTHNGKQHITTKFIEESLQEFFEEYPDIILDGYPKYGHNTIRKYRF